MSATLAPDDIVATHAEGAANDREPLLVIVVLSMMLHRMGWRRIAAAAVASVAPIAGYMVWFYSHTGQYALT